MRKIQRTSQTEECGNGDGESATVFDGTDPRRSKKVAGFAAEKGREDQGGSRGNSGRGHQKSDGKGA
jgi:hypothetical protein